MGQKNSQGDLVEKFKAYFPEWQNRPGLLSRCELVRFLEMNQLNVGKYILSSDKEELCRMFNDNHDHYLCGFVLTRLPTNHCMALAGISGDNFMVMNCAREKPKFENHPWSQLSKFDGDMLLVFIKPKKV
jgi:hypothetical protein